MYTLLIHSVGFWRVPSLLPSTPGCLSLMCLLSMLVTMVLLKLITSSYSTHKQLCLNLPTLLAAGIGTTERESVCVCYCKQKCLHCSNYVQSYSPSRLGFCPFQSNLPWKLFSIARYTSIAPFMLGLSITKNIANVTRQRDSRSENQGNKVWRIV